MFKLRDAFLNIFKLYRYHVEQLHKYNMSS